MYSFRFKLYATLAGHGHCHDCPVHRKSRKPVDLIVSDRYGRKRRDRSGASNMDCNILPVMLFGLIPFAVNQSYATQYQGNRTNSDSNDCKFCCGRNQCNFRYIVDFWYWSFPKTGRYWEPALATVIARYIEAAIVIIWAHTHKKKNRYLEDAYRGFGIPGAELKAILIKGMPLILNEVLWAAGMTTVNQCYSIRGLSVVAAVNIASTITNLFNIVYIQLGGCISIIVGQYLGAGELEEAKMHDNKMIAFQCFLLV